MEFNGINLLLILLAPLALIFVIVLLISPLHARLFDREKPLKKDIKDKGAEFKKEIKQKLRDLKEITTEHGTPPSPEQIEDFRGELKSLRKEYTAFAWNKTKEIIKVHNEESGLNDVIKQKVDNSAIFYVASMVFTIIALPIALGLSAYVLPKSAGRETYLFLLILPFIGCWFGYKGYMTQSQQKKTALILSIVVNAFYAVFLTYGILRLGK